VNKDFQKSSFAGAVLILKNDTATAQLLILSSNTGRITTELLEPNSMKMNPTALCS